MFSGAAAKKKPKATTTSSSTVSGSIVIPQLNLKPNDENDVERQIDKVREGTHEELNRRKIAVERDSDKRIAAADRFRKLQMKNIQDLYEYELANLQVQREVRIQYFFTKIFKIYNFSIESIS
jgi:hypothetical protein